jgi:hypothetical protein
MKAKIRVIIWTIVVILLIALFVPYPVEAEAKSSRQVVLENSFWSCCQSLTRKEIRDQLTNSSGIQSSEDSKGGNAGDSADSSTNLNSSWQSTLKQLLSGQYESTETFRVQCDTDLGRIDMAFRQDTSMDTGKLCVKTCSCETGDRVLNYVHMLQLQPVGSSTEANIELQIKIRVFAPWLFKSQAHSRLVASLERQLDSFATTLSNVLGEDQKDQESAE